MRGHIPIVWTVLSALAAASPQLGYPFNSQLPPVARPGEEYSYTLPSTTFTTSDGSSLTYTASGLPDWLSFDGSSRTFSGTAPSDASDSWFNFNITATDNQGESANNTATLVVSTLEEPTVDSSAVQSSLSTASSGAMAGDTAVVLSPGEEFTIQFPESVFATTGDVYGYYGVVQDHTPLPQWVSFDGSQRQFSGTAPSVNSQIAPAQWFTFVMIVSETEGFESAYLEFSIVVGAHTFATNVTEDVLNVTAGTYFEYHVPLANITLDGEPIQQANVTSISLNDTSVSWLALTASNATIAGTPPSNASSETETLEVTVTDSWGDQVSYTLLVSVNGDNDTIFTSNSLNPVNATQGEYFSYDISSFVQDKSASVETSTRPEAQWLEFHDSNMTFTGMVPDNFTQTDVTLDATSGSRSETASFYIRGVSKASKTTTASESASASASASSTAAAAAAASSGVNSKTVAIVCGVVIPIAVIAAIILLWFCIRKRNRGSVETVTSDTYNSPGRKEISRPIPMNPDDPEALMPPVFPVRSGETSTAVHSGARTPATEKGTEKDMGQFEDGWDTPQRVSAFNFMKMDGVGADDASSNYYSGDQDADTIDEPLQPPPAPGSGGPGSGSGVAGAGSPAGTFYATPPQQHTPQEMTPTDRVNATAVTTDNDRGLGVAGVRLAAGAAGAAGATGAAAAAAAARTSRASHTSDGVPRNSWRNSDLPVDGRWQEHQSLGSLATISTDELLTMRLVDRNSAGTPAVGGESEQARYSGTSVPSAPSARDSFMQPTNSTILTPHHSMMPSDASSGIIRPVGSHSSTLQHSKDNSSATASTVNAATRAPVPAMPNVAETDYATPTAEYTTPVADARNLQPSRAETIDSMEHYRTASSGEEYDEYDNHSLGSDDGAAHIRPYRNSRGELSWSHYGGADDDSDDNGAYDPNRPTSDAFGGPSKRDTIRLRDIRNGSQSGPASKPSLENTSATLPQDHSVSAELAFL